MGNLVRLTTNHRDAFAPKGGCQTLTGLNPTTNLSNLVTEDFQSRELLPSVMKESLITA
jgi:hypothetical protein